MNPYTTLRQRQQEEIDNLPIGFAFSQQQFDQMMRDWRLDPNQDIDKICPIGAGGFIQKKDEEYVSNITQRHHEEQATAIAADPTGDGFIYEMFLYELSNHEYSYTGALDVLGYTWDEVCADKRLHHGFEKASKKLLQGC